MKEIWAKDDDETSSDYNVTPATTDEDATNIYTNHHNSKRKHEDVELVHRNNKVCVKWQDVDMFYLEGLKPNRTFSGPAVVTENNDVPSIRR